MTGPGPDHELEDVGPAPSSDDTTCPVCGANYFNHQPVCQNVPYITLILHRIAAGFDRHALHDGEDIRIVAERMSEILG